MKHHGKRLGLLLTLALCWAVCIGEVTSAAPTQAEVEKAVAAIQDYDYGQSRKALLVVEKLINDTYGKAKLRADIEKNLVKLLESDTTVACTQFVCRKLRIIGTDASVPVLANMLRGTDVRAVEAACFALSEHPSPAAGRALRDAMSKAEGAALVAMINLLGERRDAQSVQAIANLSESTDAVAADAAIAALGKIATRQALEVLAELRKSDNPERRAVASHASLQCAQELETRGSLAEAKSVYEQFAASGESPHIRRGARIGLERLEKSRRVSRGGVDFTRIKPVALFDGKTFAGWEGNLDMFRIEDGAIAGGTLKKSIPRNEFLCTTREYRDFELRLKVRLLGDPKTANAGIQIRSRRIPNHHEMIGYQADMGQHYWGCLYDESRRRKILAAPDPKELSKVLKPGDWNDYVIRCVGKRVQLWINGYQTVDYTEPDDSIEQTGLIGLQIHGGPSSEAWYKDITIKEVP